MQTKQQIFCSNKLWNTIVFKKQYGRIILPNLHFFVSKNRPYNNRLISMVQGTVNMKNWKLVSISVDALFQFSMNLVQVQLVQLENTKLRLKFDRLYQTDTNLSLTLSIEDAVKKISFITPQQSLKSQLYNQRSFKNRQKQLPQGREDIGADRIIEKVLTTATGSALSWKSQVREILSKTVPPKSVFPTSRNHKVLFPLMPFKGIVCRIRALLAFGLEIIST